MKISDATFVVLDTETTGLDPMKDRIVEVAIVQWRFGGMPKTFSMLADPGIPIPPDVSGIHHITDEDVSSAFPEDRVIAVIDSLVPHNAIMVAHNAPFDRSFMEEGVFGDRSWLCTKRLAQKLIPDAPNWKNQTLRYFLCHSLAYKSTGDAHRALADAEVTFSIFHYLLDQWIHKSGEFGTRYGQGSVEDLLAFADAPIKIEKMPFGKHIGVDIASIPTDYFAYVLREIKGLSPDLKWTIQEELKTR